MFDCYVMTSVKMGFNDFNVNDVGEDGFSIVTLIMRL